MRELFDSIFDRLNESTQTRLDYYIYNKHGLNRDEQLEEHSAFFVGWAIELLIEQKIGRLRKSPQP